MPEPSVAARLVAELEQGAELVDVGGFDIDVAKALVEGAELGRVTLLGGAAIEFEWPYEVAPAVSVLVGVIVFVLAWHPWRRKLR